MCRLAVPLSALVLAAPAAGAGRLRLPSPLPARTIDLPVLMYHRIGPVLPTLPAITQRLTVDPSDFEAQMEWLKAHRFHAVTPLRAFEALEYGRPLPSKPILITFDDGYRDVLWHAAPVLHRLHMPAVEFVITDRISGSDPSFLTWPQLARLEHFGVAIGSHTVTHPDLTSLSSAQAWAELTDSRRTIEQHLGHPVQWFAYPFGGVDPHVAAMVRAAGYVLAVTTQGGIDQQAAQPLELHRDEVLDTTTVPELAALLGGQ